MSCFSTTSANRVCAGLVIVLVAGAACVAGDGMAAGRGGGPPVYQRRALDWKHGHRGMHGDRHGRRHDRGPAWVAPQVSAGWFQRPYPYHLDYYRMRYGGSYAPYFGNLYGPPQVVTAPPYYGPYYGGYDMPNGYGAPGYENGPALVEPNQLPGVGQSRADEASENAPSATGL